MQKNREPRSSVARSSILAAAIAALPILGAVSNVRAADLYETLNSSSGNFEEGDTIDISVDIVPFLSEPNSIEWTLYLGADSTWGTGTPAMLTGVVFAQDDFSAAWDISGSVYYEASPEETFSGNGTFTINNVAPTITGARLNGTDNEFEPVTVNEGDYVTVEMDSTDPGADEHTYEINGSFAGVDYNTSGTRYSTIYSEMFIHSGLTPVDFVVYDDDTSTSTTRWLDVQNVAPTIETAMLNGFDDGTGLTVNEGDYVYATLESTDPGADGHTFTVNVDGGPNLDGSHDFTDVGTRYSIGAEVTQQQDGTYTITFGATDDADSTFTTRTLTVLNVAPTIIDAPTDQTIDFNVTTVLDYSVNAIDPGLDDPMFVAWDLDGDGEFDDDSSFFGSIDMSQFGFPNGHILNLGVMVSDDDDFTIHNFSVTLTNVPEPTTLGLLGAIGTLALRRRSEGRASSCAAIVE